MTTKTPPAWELKAAGHLHALDSVVRSPEELRENAAIISSYAPDAEALALALENAIEEMKSWQVDWELMAQDPHYEPKFSNGTKSAIAALAAYRAKYPKA